MPPRSVRILEPEQEEEPLENETLPEKGSLRTKIRAPPAAEPEPHHPSAMEAPMEDPTVFKVELDEDCVASMAGDQEGGQDYSSMQGQTSGTQA